MIKNIIEDTDSVIKDQEDELITKINVAYLKAVKAAQEEFKALANLKEDEKVSSTEVKTILKKSLDAFEKEYLELVKPIQEASLEAYKLGLKETAQFVKAVTEKE